MVVTCQDVGIESNQSRRAIDMASRQDGHRGAAAPAIPAPSREELELLRLLSEGRSADAIGRRLGLSERTVRRRFRALCDRVGVDSPIEAVVWAVRGRHI
jgi:DNA-binding NarL/FixJ family response regulator